MRKITKDIARSFFNGEKKTISNTHTDGKSVFLHGNKIVRTLEYGPVVNSIQFSLAGWNTVTTRERLNGIVPGRIFTRKGQAYWTKPNGTIVELDDTEWYAF